jgi:hypothetical protein
LNLDSKKSAKGTLVHVTVKNKLSPEKDTLGKKLETIKR